MFYCGFGFSKSELDLFKYRVLVFSGGMKTDKRQRILLNNLHFSYFIRLRPPQDPPHLCSLFLGS